MTFQDQLDSDLENVFFNDDEFARDVTYAGATIKAVETDGYEITTSIPGVNVPTRSLLVMESDVPNPKAGDTVVIDGQTWYVAPGPMLDGGLWMLTLNKEIRRVGV